MSRPLRLAIAGVGLLTTFGLFAYMRHLLLGPPSFPPEEGALVRLAEGSPTLTEFTTFGCPHCRRYTTEVLRTALEEARNKGYGYAVRHLNLHPGDGLLNRAVYCAYETGGKELYLQVRLLLVEAYARLYPYDSLQRLEGELHRAGLPVEDLTHCLRTPGQHPQEVLDEEAARRLNLAATPAFFLDGKRLLGYPGRARFLAFLK
uniref:Thioredoxin-like fold domain-containing protein n=1 Tax=Thermus caliditerrae TaxID=1330700 RepID=A0A7C5RDT2_9DEIN